MITVENDYSLFKLSKNHWDHMLMQVFRSGDNVQLSYPPKQALPDELHSVLWLSSGNFFDRGVGKIYCNFYCYANFLLLQVQTF